LILLTPPSKAQNYPVLPSTIEHPDVADIYGGIMNAQRICHVCLTTDSELPAIPDCPGCSPDLTQGERQFWSTNPDGYDMPQDTQDGYLGVPDGYSSVFDTLSPAFDEMLQRMQLPEVRIAFKRAFDASSLPMPKVSKPSRKPLWMIVLSWFADTTTQPPKQ
jgi:hypothetical protein